MVAYLEKFGLFNSDLLVVVLSSHDAGDVPTFAPLDSNTHPTCAPMLALTEAITRYLPRYLPTFGARQSNRVLNQDAEIDPRAIGGVTQLAKLQIPTCFVLHPTRHEFEAGKWDAGYAAIRTATGNANIVDETPYIKSQADYLDDIHHSSDGQKSLARAIAACAGTLSRERGM